MSWIPGWDSVASAGWWSGVYFWLGIGALIALGAFEVASHRYSDRKDELAAAEQKATQKQHDEEMARLHLETANAQRATEELRQRNLELEQAVAPRIFDPRPAIQPLTAFKGTKVALVAVPDLEARRLERMVAEALASAQWDITFLPATENLMDGINVEYISGLHIERDPATHQVISTAMINENLGNTVDALITELKRQKIEAAPGKWGAVDPDRTAKNLSLPAIDGIVVRIGMKPISYFMEEKFPAFKAAREQIDAAMKRMNERQQQAQEKRDQLFREQQEYQRTGKPPQPQ